MHKPAAPYARLRRGLTALCAAALCSALAARGDDLQDASKFLKAGQHAQALERVNKALKVDSSNSGAKNKLSLVRELVREPTVVAVVKEPSKPKEPAKPAADPSAEVLKAVNGWAEAWSKKDANAYLSYYAGDFKTPGGEARPAWEKTRRERIAAPKSIEVKVDSPKVTLRGSNEASVTFRQDYRSDKLTSANTKTLELVMADGRWQIREEKAGR